MLTRSHVSRRRPAAASRGLVSRTLRRVTLPLARMRLPRFAGLAACLVFLLGASAYGVIKGDHLATIQSADQGRRRRGRERGRACASRPCRCRASAR